MFQIHWMGSFACICISTYIFAKDPLSKPYETLRETCRKQIAGIYLTLHDEVYLLKQVILSHQRQQKKLSQALQKQDTHILSLTAITAKPGYTYENARRLQEAQRFQKDLSNHHDNIVHIIDSSQKQLHELEQREKTLKKNIATVFQFETTQNHQKIIQITYQQFCPKFYANCPLSRIFANALKTIFTEPTSIPQACVRYADFLR